MQISTRLPITAYILVATLLLASCGGSDQTASAPGRQLASTLALNSTPAFSGNRAGYRISRIDTGYRVFDLVGSSGATDFAPTVERIKFADMTVNLGIGAKSLTVSSSDLKLLVELYIAFFNRVPDADGLSYWIDQFNAGQSIDQIADSFYGAAVQYPSLTGYSAKMTASDFVRVIYKNVLGRSGGSAPPDSDVLFWAGELTSGRATKGTLVRTMLNSAHSFTNDATWGWVPALLDNKYTVGEYVAIQHGINYNTAEESIAKTMAIGSAVTPRSITAALQSVGVSNPEFNLVYVPPSKSIPVAPMRAAHMDGNWGGNTQGIRTTVQGYFPGALPIKADNVQVYVNRSSYVDQAGVKQTNDVAQVELNNVKIGDQSLPRAGFWVVQDVNTKRKVLQFRPSFDPVLKQIQGFAGDITISLPSSTEALDLSQLALASGPARDYVLAVLANGASLFPTTNYKLNSPAALDQQTISQVFKDITERDQQVKIAYFEFLKAQNIQWLGISVAMFYDSLADPTVRPQYRPQGTADSGIYTYEDADLKAFIRKAKALGFKIYLTLAFETVDMAKAATDPYCKTIQYKPERYLMGQPVVYPDGWRQACINPSDWWWNPLHPNHATNVAKFWNSYTDVAVRYAYIAQQLGVDMYSLGTETEYLFRTQASTAPYTNHFKTQLVDMVNAVRMVYSGLVTYDQHFTALTGPVPGTHSLFKDLDLDVIGISAYFPLVTSAPKAVLSVTELESAWDTVFRNYLTPLRLANPTKPIVFTEFGYTDAVESPFDPPAGANASLGLRDSSGATSGMLQQKNIFQAFFNVNERNKNLVSGTFIWGTQVFTDSPYLCSEVNFNMYCKPLQETIKNIYGKTVTAQ